MSNTEITYLEKLIESIASSYKPDGRLTAEQVFLLCLYKRELERLSLSHEDVEIKNESSNI